MSTMKSNKASKNYYTEIESIKSGGKTLVMKIKDLFNSYLRNKSMPSKWNKAVTILLYKKGDQTNLENYRSIY